MKLIIGNKNYSSWSLRPWLLLSFYQLDFEEVRIALFETGWEETLRLYSQAGFVPVLHDKGLHIWDSIAICEYVSEQYLDGKAWPQNPEDRAIARSCAAEMHAGFANIRNQMPMNARASNRQVEFTAAVNKEIARIDSLWNKLRATHKAKGDWLFGEFSIVDCMFAPMVFRFNTYGVKLSGEALNYLKFFLEQPLMQDWLAAAREEEEVIERSEVGVV